MSSGESPAGTLDRWMDSPLPPDPRPGRLFDSIRYFAASQGSAGFTAEEFRARVGWNDVSPHVVSAAVGNLVSRGILVAVSREASKHPAANGRWVSRFVLADPQEGP